MTPHGKRTEGTRFPSTTYRPAQNRPAAHGGGSVTLLERALDMLERHEWVGIYNSNETKTGCPECGAASPDAIHGWYGSRAAKPGRYYEGQGEHFDACVWLAIMREAGRRPLEHPAWCAWCAEELPGVARLPGVVQQLCPTCSAVKAART